MRGTMPPEAQERMMPKRIHSTPASRSQTRRYVAGAWSLLITMYMKRSRLAGVWAVRAVKWSQIPQPTPRVTTKKRPSSRGTAEASPAGGEVDGLAVGEGNGVAGPTGLA